MIKGKVVARDNSSVVVDANGVGYKVTLANGIGSYLAEKEDIVRLFIHTHVREDLIELYGFLAFEELKLFEQLISVSGVGPKTAINVFSVGDKDSIIKAIIDGDVSFFTTVPRLGRKNAQKIIIELRTKFGEDKELDLSEKDIKENADVIAALKKFGFSQKEAVGAIKDTKQRGKTTEERIKLALKYLGK